MEKRVEDRTTAFTAHGVELRKQKHWNPVPEEVYTNPNYNFREWGQVNE